MYEINLNEFSTLKKIILKYFHQISDEKVEKILEMVKKFSPRILLSKKNISIKQSSGRSFIVLTDFMAVKCFTLTENYLADLRPILKLNQIGFKHIVQLLDYNSDYNLLGMEKLKLIYKGKYLLQEYTNFEFIKNLIYIIVNTISTLFIYNSQINKDFSVSNVGINSLGIVKVFDFELCCYIDKNNEYQCRVDLYYTFRGFMDDLILSIKNKNIRKIIKSFLMILIVN